MTIFFLAVGLFVLIGMDVKGNAGVFAKVVVTLFCFSAGIYFYLQGGGL